MDFVSKMRDCIRIAREAGTDSELVMHHYNNEWSFGLGNPTISVMLGEVSAIFDGGWHNDPETALDALWQILRRTGGVPPDTRTDEEKRRDAQTVEEWNEEQESLDNEAQARGEFVLRVRKIRASDIAANSIAAPPIDVRVSGIMSSDAVADELEIKRDEE